MAKFPLRAAKYGDASAAAEQVANVRMVFIRMAAVNDAAWHHGLRPRQNLAKAMASPGAASALGRDDEIAAQDLANARSNDLQPATLQDVRIDPCSAQPSYGG
jgi:hypothetical protein